MLLQITHSTELIYDAMISESVMELRVAPRQEMYQHRLSFDLAIGPAAQVSSYFDWLGNTVHAFTINAFHDVIKIVAQSVLKVDRIAVDLTNTPDHFPPAPPSDYTLVDYLTFGGPIVDCSQLRSLVDSLEIVEGMPLGRAALLMMNTVHDRFTYQQGVTHSASPITDILDHGKGVCQDFTHLFIAMARALKIPARYVSGLIHPIDESNHSLRGTTQTHAWCELFFPNQGWIGLDPTNRQQVDDNYVTIAFGRDYRDVAPNRGVFRGGANETMNVTVHSHRLESVPEELAAERVRAIGVPIYPGWGRERQTLPTAQQAAQQQQ